MNENIKEDQLEQQESENEELPVESRESDDEEDYSEINEEEESSFFEEKSEEESKPSVNASSAGMDVTDLYMNTYRTEADKDAIKAIRNEWKKNKKSKKLTPVGTILMLVVAGVLPWYSWNQREDIAYFFSPKEPIDLGLAQDYRITEDGQTDKVEAFEDNRYSTIRGIPFHRVSIKGKDGIFSTNKEKFLFQLLGSTVYVQENQENSKFVDFMSQTTPAFGMNQGVEELQISGRLRRFGQADSKKYAPVRDYYAQRFGTIFCETLSPADKKRRESLLGKGGVALQIMPDGAIIQSETDTHSTLVDVEPLRGRSALAIGKDNTILHSIDGGLTWRKSKLPVDTQATSITRSPSGEQIVFGGNHGWIGNESYSPDPKALSISQDVLDVVFTDPEPGDTTSPRMISVGREGLIQTAYINREGWFPARINDSYTFHDVLRTSDKWFAAGSLLMHRSETDNTWTHDVQPQKTEWLSLTEIPGYVVATGKKGAIARYDLTKPDAQWENWAVDDVPGIDFDADLNASAISEDGKTWVAVGDKGSIVVAKVDETGKFAPVQRISGQYASYGVVRDILAGNSVEQSLYEALQRYTTDDFNDVTYHDGTFYAVGKDSLLMTSNDGLSWHKRDLHVKHKDLNVVVFTGEKTGVIGGEKGTMLITDDNGETWRSKKSSTERSIYDIAVTPEAGKAFVFAGAYGLWGYCEGTDGACHLRNKNDSYHYNAIAFDKGEQKKTAYHLMAVGNDSHIDKIDDQSGTSAIKTSLFEKARSNVTGIALAVNELPLRPDSPRGQIGLIATDKGTLYRSYDAGYTFKREDSGLKNEITKLVMTRNGDIAWAFDEQGNAVEDLHGQGKWKAFANRYISGTFVQTIGYLIDENCVYRKMPEAEPVKVTCAANGMKLHDITNDGETIAVGLYQNNIYSVAVLEKDELVQRGPAAEKADLSANARLIQCGVQTAVLDYGKRQVILNGEIIENASDAACIDGNLTTLTWQPIRPGVWTISARATDELWSMEVGFDPSSARFTRAGSDWWLSSEAPESAEPLILMSHDGKTWSWRRNTLTDYHAVATAGAYAVAVGDNNTILVSEDYGATWTAQSLTSNKQTLRDVCLSSDGSFGLAVGDAGLIYRSQNNLNRWSKLKYKLEFDITSCTIAERPEGLQIYFAGKGGAIYTTNTEMSHLDLVASPALEDIYSITTLETGEVIAVGGVYQDPSSVCENGYLIESDRDPHSYWKTILIVAIMALIWLFTIYKFLTGLKATMKKEEETDITVS